MNYGSFANIARATPDQLRNLPGFGQVKVKNIENAFEKPFRNQVTSSIAASLSQKQAVQPPTASTSRAGLQAPTTRSKSPAWDIEVDDAALPNEDEEIVVMQKKTKPRIFDVDLDLTMT